MGFFVTKIVQTLLLPPANLLLMTVFGAVLIRRNRTAGRALIALALVLLYLLSLPLTADMLMRPLESHAPSPGGEAISADAVVVLGCGVMDLSWVPAPPAPSETSTARLIAGIEIAQRLNLPLVLSGGSGAIADVPVREADAMADQAVRLGFPRERIRTDSSSRNTLENAAAVRSIVPGDDIVLVTSAFHLRRASAFFREQGFTVIPAATAYRAQSRPSSLANLLPRAEHLATSSLALSEHLSTAWYRLQHKI